MDLGMLHRLTDFVGAGSFVIGKQGAFAQAWANDFYDFGNRPSTEPRVFMRCV